MQIFVTSFTDNAPEDYGYTYAWTPSVDLSTDTSSRPIFSGVGTYVYSITATLNHEGCTGSHVMTLHSKQPTPILNVTDDTKINFGESIQLFAGNTLHYYWSPNDGSLNNPNINNPIATPTVTTTYTITGMDFYGCKDVKYVTIVVDSSQNEFIPTGFTPNGDGLNDVFRLRGSTLHKMVEFRVYNRWGQQVFYTTSKDGGWDGTFGGQPAPMGVYHYTVIVARPGHQHNQVIKGDVTLIR
jgi:gliding motility-associated-like protein